MTHDTYLGIRTQEFNHLNRNASPIMEHEITGILEEPGASGIPEGTMVAVNPLLACGSVRRLPKGVGACLPNLRLLGIEASGSMAEVLAVSIANLFAFSGNAPATEAALAEPLAVAVHAVRRSRMVPGERVLIFGAGPIGILVALVARLRGAKDVLLIEPSESRRRGVETLGFMALAPQHTPIARDNHDAATDVVFNSPDTPVSRRPERRRPPFGDAS
ncbi:alcohol dehydrogenase catalytic domain-containing protein [Arthrobacter sp. 4R501]|uniref:alcohol dehydrogenase catalytic domain-containing protein n=1 Tax=Arthrobacter sp. 4R501 TaxID=2058886 RepID=UPI000CE5541F|nr:alcohol dehydrogenase catalytic domain-containing protein [Arthrobacter sp. 4R501]